MSHSIFSSQQVTTTQESAQQWSTETEFVKTLDLNTYTDEALYAAIQEHLIVTYGTITQRRWIFFREHLPVKYPKIKTVKMAKSVLLKQRLRDLYWSERLGETDIENQWTRDVLHLKTHSDSEPRFFLKYGPSDIEKFVKRQRELDYYKQVINKQDENYPVFTRDERSYYFFLKKIEKASYYEPPL